MLPTPYFCYFFQTVNRIINLIGQQFSHLTRARTCCMKCRHGYSAICFMPLEFPALRYWVSLFTFLGRLAGWLAGWMADKQGGLYCPFMVQQQFLSFSHWLAGENLNLTSTTSSSPTHLYIQVVVPPS